MLDLKTFKSEFSNFYFFKVEEVAKNGAKKGEA